MEIKQVPLQENEPRFDVLAFRCLSCDYEQEHVHAYVTTAESACRQQILIM